MKGGRFSTPHPRPQALRQNAAGFHAKSVASPHCMTAVRASTETYMAADKHMDDADALALHKDTASGTNSLGKLPAAAAEEEEAAVLFPSERPGALSYAWPQCTTREAAQQADAPKIRPSPPFFRVERRLHEEILHSSFSFRLLPASDSIAASASPTRHMH